MDWLDEFEKRFRDFPEIKRIKENHFHGSVEIHFSDGQPMNYDMKIHRRHEVKKV